MVFSVPNFTPKQLAGILLLISVSVIIHVWYAYYILEFANDVSSFLTIANGRFRKNLPALAGRNDIKFILLWRTYSLKGYLKNLSCDVQNCIFTENARLLREYTSFDAIVFNDNMLDDSDSKPKLRSSSQLYIFATMESPSTAPACELYNDDYYNWTLTYRLDSTVLWLFFTVRNRTGAIIAPGYNPEWEEDDGPIAEELKPILHGKTKAAAWIVSHCATNSDRSTYLISLQEHLYHFSLNIDVYGACSDVECPGEDCNDIIKRDYYFYLAFENSIVEDYVTEKVLHGYKNRAVPIVFGGANYSRFLPPGSYINAMELHPYNLAHTMKQIIDDPQLYEKYFTWTNLYTIEYDPVINNPLCSLCAAMNEKQVKNTPAIREFRLWWNGGRDGMKWCLNTHYSNETHTIKSHLDPEQLFRRIEFYSPGGKQIKVKPRLIANKTKRIIKKSTNTTFRTSSYVPYYY